MEKKNVWLGTLLTVGAAAAAGAVLYSKRNEIRGFLADHFRVEVEKLDEETPDETLPEDEDDVGLVIDISVGREEKEAEDAGED